MTEKTSYSPNVNKLRPPKGCISHGPSGGGQLKLPNRKRHARLDPSASPTAYGLPGLANPISVLNEPNTKFI